MIFMSGGDQIPVMMVCDVVCQWVVVRFQTGWNGLDAFVQSDKPTVFVVVFCLRDTLQKITQCRMRADYVESFF
jgi:hypothetical protein